jgi:hypothetical protein
MGATKPGESDVHPDLFVSRRGENEVAGRLEALPGQRCDRRRRRGDVPLHVQRAAAPHAVLVEVAGPGIDRPFIRIGDDRVGVREEQQAGPVAAAGNPGNQARALGLERVQLARNARVLQVRTEQLGRSRLVPRRVDGVQAEQLLQEPDSLVPECHGRHGVPASILVP